jgi:hypothetical protein
MARPVDMTLGEGANGAPVLEPEFAKPEFLHNSDE